MTFSLARISEGEAEELCVSSQYAPMCVSTKWYPWTLYLNKDQRYLGRCYAWLESRHVDLHSFGALTLHEHCILVELVRAYEKTVASLWGPALCNVAWLGNEIHSHRGHGHLHLIPRYATPPSWNGRSFPDLQFGKNYAPYKKLKLPEKELYLLREILEEELRKYA